MTDHDHICRKEVSRILNVSVSTVIRLTKSGEMPACFKIGKRTFWSKHEISAYLAEQKAKGRQNKVTPVPPAGERNVEKDQ